MTEAFSHPGKGTIYIVMELVNGLTVKKYVKHEINKLKPKISQALCKSEMKEKEFSQLD